MSSSFFNDTATPEIYTLPLHDALPIWDYGLHEVQFDVFRYARNALVVAAHCNAVVRFVYLVQAELVGYDARSAVSANDYFRAELAGNLVFHTHSLDSDNEAVFGQ